VKNTKLPVMEHAVLDPETAELVDGGRRAISETRRLLEEKRFILWWTNTQRAPGARLTSLLLPEGDEEPD
jgi:hypothetical protein